jgi:hypothetical protein
MCYRHFFSSLLRISSIYGNLNPSPQPSFSRHGRLAPTPFQQSIGDESEIRKLVKNHFLPDWAVLQRRPAIGEDITTPNTKEIVLFSSFFQRRFGLPICDILPRLHDHYQIKLVHLNPNSILKITVFADLYEAFLGIPPNFPLLKNYMFLKYQLSAANQKVIRGVGLRTRPRCRFLKFPMKTSLRGWHRTCFYCENHEPSLPSFAGRLPKYQGTWGEETIPIEFPHVAALTNKFNALKEHNMTGVCVAAHWLACQVVPLKKSPPGLGI